MTENAIPEKEAAPQAPAKPAKNKRPNQRPNPRAPNTEAHKVLERLFQLYPKMFGARFLPLKLGVYQELLAAHPDDFKKDDLKVALGLHARSTRYLEAVAAGEKRHGLDGEPVEDVAPEHVQHAIFEVFRRRQARSKESLRPWLVGRLASVIEASGMERDAWLERAPVTDELSVSALDEAFAKLAEGNAKREALRRAFQASGKTAAEFADMYGMDLADVERAVG